MQYEIDNVELMHQSEGAGLFRFLDWPDSEDTWIPWSLVEEGSPSKDGDVGTLILPDWKARSLGFEL
jgi:hypothetical protein